MKFGSVCSGIEAASVAWHPLGWKAAWLSEIEPFPSALLAHHYPDVSNLGDMTKLTPRILAGEIEAPDLFCGGTPCQAFSVAGLRKSLDDARGNLSLTFCEIANAIDEMRSVQQSNPCIVFWENVPGVLNTKDNAFGCFLGALAGEDDALVPPGGRWTNAGFIDGPQRAVAWRVLDAQYFGVAQRRRRVFVVASARADFDPAAVLFEFEGVRRDTAPSREKGQRVADTLTVGANQCSKFHGDITEQPENPVITARMVAFGEYVDDGTASAMKARDYKDATDLVMQPIAFSGQMSNPHTDVDIMQTLQAKNPMAVAFGGDIARTLQARHDSSPCADRGMDVVAVMLPAYTTKLHNTTSNQSGKVYEEYSTSLDRSSPPPALLTAMQVRRLTPVECERLQGFPDNYTDIKAKGKPTPDGPRYKALGNSWAVPVVRWIGSRIQRALT